jgi:hypothetical protein
MESHGEFQVLADIRVRRGDGTVLASPGLRAGPQGSQPIDAVVADLGPLQVQRIDADRGRVAVRLPGGSPSRVAMVELSTHPFVNLVWIGALLALVGSGLAGLRRAGERSQRGAARRSASAYTAPA